MVPLNIDPLRRRYRALIGTGGIGSGMFFALNGNHTLGREESRSGRLLKRKDYCKLHIITHYVQVLMGRDFLVLPIGRVGDDDPGRLLLNEMDETGYDLRYVRALPGEQTLFSICFAYPDGGGGNMTVDDSACAKVTGAAIQEAERDFAAFAGEGMALAAPEVPLPARAELLESATKHRFLRAASFLSGEIAEARDSGLLDKVDLLALNIDEAAVLVEMPKDDKPAAIAQAAIGLLKDIKHSMFVSVTAGKNGSWAWDGEKAIHLPICDVEAAGTAGAGDAHLGGILVGLAAGLTMAEAHELGVLTAACSVTSPDTINKRADCRSLKTLADKTKMPLSAGVRKLLTV